MTTIDPLKTYDTTQLHTAQHQYRLSRDYAAHCFRWGWASRAISSAGRDVTVLDLGCGTDTPLARIINADLDAGPRLARMTCVDFGAITRAPAYRWLETREHFDVTKSWRQLEKADLVFCFEVLEHMPKPRGVLLLKAIAKLIADDGYALLSTPVFSGRMAKNHVHEWGVDELQQALDKAGLDVVDRWGTFMPYRKVVRALKAAGLLEVLDTYERLRRFYDDEVLANFLAPIFPDYASNNVWKLRPQ